MFFRADIHTHSHYAEGTSPQLCLENMYQWAQIKGIHILGTGDFTHPAWFAELKEKLVPDNKGFFKLKDKPNRTQLNDANLKDIDVRFCLATEISSVYSFNNKVRKIHNLVYAPDFETAEKINKALSKYADLSKDGRPTIPLSSRNLLELLLTISEQAYLIPAHAWTPWFSVLGSNNGYDSIDECFRDFTHHIFALETGLSSDPAMNWKWSKHDRFTMLSSSDAHRLETLGREVNCFDCDMSYEGMFNAIKTNIGFKGTYEFFPEEGKYSYDGHRKCGVCLSPEETMAQGNICPVCKKRLTIGVMHRVEALADRTAPQKPAVAAGFDYIIPLPEIISEIEKCGVDSKKVNKSYMNALSFAGNEFALLKEMPVEDITSFKPILGEAIRRMRAGEVSRIAGYDGVYGKIKLFADEIRLDSSKQCSLF